MSKSLFSQSICEKDPCDFLYSFVYKGICSYGEVTDADHRSMNKKSITFSERQRNEVITFLAGEQPAIHFAILTAAYCPQGNVKATHCHGTRATYPKRPSHP